MNAKFSLRAIFLVPFSGADGSLAGSGGSTVVVLGSWERGERYLHNILQDFNHWAVGWTDWNLALDLQVTVVINVLNASKVDVVLLLGWSKLGVQFCGLPGDCQRRSG